MDVDQFGSNHVNLCCFLLFFNSSGLFVYGQIATKKNEIHNKVAPSVGNAMSSSKFDIERFTGQNDFGLWRIKMKTILVQQGAIDALKGEQDLPELLTAREKSDILDRAHSSIILCLGDKVLREVAGERYGRNLKFSIRQSL